jgi:hypothetical protein
MTTKDPVTGLPSLPEPDLFFRVLKNSVQLLRKLPDTEWGPYPESRYSIYNDYSRETETRTVSYLAQEKGWFNLKKEVVKQKEEYRRVNRLELVSEAYTELLPEDPNNPKKIKWEVITKKTIPVLAERALNKYLKTQELETLLGDYPPKSLS